MAVQPADRTAETGEDLTLSFFNEKICWVCKKHFCTHGDWAYKRKTNYKWRYYCSYSCKRKDEHKNPEKTRDVMAEAEMEERIKKKPQERRKTAYELVNVIREGMNPIEYLKSQGHGNPYEAYNAVRHYAYTNMSPAVCQVLKPLRELKKERNNAAQTEAEQ